MTSHLSASQGNGYFPWQDDSHSLFFCDFYFTEHLFKARYSGRATFHQQGREFISTMGKSLQPHPVVIPLVQQERKKQVHLPGLLG